MNFFQELRQRRVPQYTSGYIVASWGLIQFLTFLESRMAVSPHLVNVVGIALLLLLPAVITLAWVHGRPGKDTWGRTPKVIVAANLLAAVLMVAFLSSGRDLGAVTQTIAVEDENGAVTERVVPKSEYRRRLLLFYPDHGAGDDDSFSRETMAFMLSLDLSQDDFIDAVMPMTIAGTFRDAGSEDGHGLPQQLKRKIARDAHIDHFMTGSLTRSDGEWQLVSELHESETGKVVARRTNKAADQFALADLVSHQLREDLGIPAAQLNDNPDLPIAEMVSADAEAVASYMQALVAVAHHNDWTGAVPHLELAVERDPDFTLALFLLFAVHQTLGNADAASADIAAAMDNIYRVPERLGFMIKAQYYYSEKQDADKAMAVLKMWSQIYPNDVSAYEQLATHMIIRQDLPGAIAAYEQILAIDPSRVQYLENLADLHRQVGDFDQAEECLKRYVEAYPARADGYENLADFYSLTGRLDEAREALSRAQLLDSGNLSLALGLIDLDIKIGKFDESEQALAALMAESETPRDRLRIYGRQLNLAALQGRPDEVISIIEAFHATRLEIQNPLQANLIYSMILPVVSMAGRPNEALVMLADVESQMPAPYGDLVGAGEAWVYADLGQVEEARTSLARAVAVVESFKFETMRAQIMLIEGMIAEAEGELDAAIAHYRDALDNAIKIMPIFKIRLIQTLRRDGQYDEAMTQLEEALKVNPAHPEYQLELAQLYYEKGSMAKARASLDRALTTWKKAGPEYRPAQEAQRLADQLKAS